MRYCNHSRRIWIKIIEETASGERVDFGEEGLQLADDTEAATPSRGQEWRLIFPVRMQVRHGLLAHECAI